MNKRSEEVRSGVYSIRCNPSGHVYIGATANLKLRRFTHFSQIQSGMRFAFSRVTSLTDAKHFSWDVLEETPSPNELSDAEFLWQCKYRRELGDLLLSNPMNVYRPKRGKGLRTDEILKDFRAFCVSNDLVPTQTLQTVLSDFMKGFQRHSVVLGAGTAPSTATKAYGCGLQSRSQPMEPRGGDGRREGKLEKD